jgi:2-polyprenyl-6-hydroxyphenyl methylase/3-demethylubiquinone-9 3-methyltransferase
MPPPARLVSLLPLDRANARAAAIPCKVCGHPAPFFDVVDFNKCAGFYQFGPSGVPVSYHRCVECGFLFTAFFDDWSDEDFRRFIYNEDYWLVDPEYQAIRPRQVADHLAALLEDQRQARILDYGAGSGLFAQRLVELGFHDVTSYDPISLPIRPSGRFDIITCTEVIEHSPTPMASFEDMRSLLAEPGCIILGETLQPPEIGVIRANWWYVAPRNGHVSTFADVTLARLAERLELLFHRGAGHHVLRTPGDGSLAMLAQRIGPPMACFRLHAPADGPADGFHGVEGPPGDRYRWTATDTLSWSITVPPGPPRLVQIAIPYVHESRKNFAAGCRVQIGGKPEKPAVRDAALVAETDTISPGPVAVTLRTPEPLRPAGYPRQLGLAIAVAETT